MRYRFIQHGFMFAVLLLSAGCVSRARFEALEATNQELKRQIDAREARHEKEVERERADAREAGRSADEIEKRSTLKFEQCRVDLAAMGERLNQASSEAAFLRGANEASKKPLPSPQPQRPSGVVVVAPINSQQPVSVNVGIPNNK